MKRPMSPRTPLVFAFAFATACAAAPAPSPYPLPLAPASAPAPAPAVDASPTPPASAKATATTPPPTPPPKDPLEVTVVATDAARAIVDATDRSDADRALDPGRHPAEILTLVGAAPGKRIAEIGAWHGYTAELFARAVAPNGTVFAQDPAAFDKFTREAWAARAKSPALKNVVRVSREYADPIAANVKNLDAVVCGLFYHDMVWLKVDRAKMNAAIYRALAPGGFYVVYDHSAREGAGVSEAKTLHRIEEKVVRAEIEAAGFQLAAVASFLRNPSDARDWSASDEAPKERRGTSDRFVLKYVKP